MSGMAESSHNESDSDSILVVVSEREPPYSPRIRTTRSQRQDRARIIATKQIKISPKCTVNDLAQAYYDVARPSVVVQDANTGDILEVDATLEEVGITEDGARVTILLVRRGKMMSMLESITGSMDKLMTCHFLLWAFITCIFVVLMAFVGRTADNVRRADPVAYSLVIDAGSVHSAVSVYSWSINKTHEMEEVFNCEFEDERGISSFVNRPEEVRSYITDSSCFQTAISYVPKAARNNTNIYLGGTGGMRAMMYTNPVQTRQILGNATEALETTGFQIGAAEIIDGVNEGVYGWITVNGHYLTSESNCTKDHEVDPEVGSLDWGGASTQITFPAHEADGINVSDVSERNGFQSIRVFNQSHDIYTVSHMCYGQEEALKRYLVGLVYDKFINFKYIGFRFNSPCHPRGYEALKVKGYDLFGKCTHLKNEDFNTLLSEKLPETFTFVGTGNQRLCQARIDAQFDKKLCRQTYQHHQTCFDTEKVVKPRDDLQFRAFSTYWYLVEVFKVPADQAESLESLKISLRKFDEVTKEICASKRIGLLSTWGPDRVHNSCFRAMFMRKLLVDGYGFKADWLSRLDFVSKVDGSSVGWTKGYMMYHASIDHVTFARDNERFILLTLAFVALLVVALVFIGQFPRIVAGMIELFEKIRDNWCAGDSGSDQADSTYNSNNRNSAAAESNLAESSVVEVEGDTTKNTNNTNNSRNTRNSNNTTATSRTTYEDDDDLHKYTP